MSRNKEKQNNELNRLYLSKLKRPKVKRPHLQTTSVRYTNEKVESMYKQISELENEHKNFRRKIAQVELGANVNVLTKTIPVEKSIHFYTKKSINHQHETLNEFFNKKIDLPLLSMNDYQIESLEKNLTVINNDKPLKNNTLVDYSDSD
ncbi:unnamed protein product [Rotaria sp. Silwood1]|nr:unnamed protein product [Rotaria sp. Silwood1]